MDTTSRGAASVRAGVIAGAALAPVFAVGSYVRRARVLHPRGSVLWGHVVAIAGEGPGHELGARLAGSVLARFSGAWWKHHEWLDVLGCALRFTHASAPSAQAAFGDQDLLLATIRVPMTTLFAPLTTRVHDYLGNSYFGVSPEHPAPAGASRGERLDLALDAGLRLKLEARPAQLGAPYQPIADIHLCERVLLDQEALSFDPFRDGCGLSPVGFVHSMRIASYAASRKGRAAARSR